MNYSRIPFATIIGWSRLYFRDKDAAFRELEELLTLYNGNVTRTAHALGYRSRRNFYQIAKRDPDIVWPMVDRVRTAALARLDERRRLLTGDS